MQIIYLHHAERNITEGHFDPELRQLEDITENGIRETELLAEKYKNKSITAIVTSPYLRCKHTAEILNKYHDVPLIEDDRFNEKEKDEEWQHLLERNMEAINDIFEKFDDDSTIICVTSGVNLSAFICYFYNLKPSNDIPWSQAGSVSPVIFTKGKQMLD